MNLQKEFVPYEEALALKELGFDEPCFKTMLDFDITYKSNVKMPLYQQAFRWFRKKYNLPCWVYTSNNEEFWYSILKDGRIMVREHKPFNTYEEAELACLRKLIEKIQGGNK